MIEVEQLTKSYNGKTAVDAISFEVGKGEIVGFLGPNGAGKTTTMRMLTGYLAATSGTARVAGYDVFRQSLEARRQIGYMPESVPLYTDMRVREYLHFRARLKGLSGREMRDRVWETMELCGILDVRRAIIGSLSKGYRQRVGLADALVHKPALLILDEPTNGLDPNQIRQVRDLIRTLGEQHTILLSTHILPEVEITCGRVIIIDQGTIKASDTPEKLMARVRTAGLVTAELKGNPDRIAKALGRIDGVKKVSVVSKDGDWTAFEIRVQSAADIREEIHRQSIQQNWSLRHLSQTPVRLEDVFADLTAKPAG